MIPKARHPRLRLIPGAVTGPRFRKVRKVAEALKVANHRGDGSQLSRDLLRFDRRTQIEVYGLKGAKEMAEREAVAYRFLNRTLKTPENFRGNRKLNQLRDTLRAFVKSQRKGDRSYTEDIISILTNKGVMEGETDAINNAIKAIQNYRR